MVHVYVELSAAFSKTTDIPTEVDSDEYGYQSDSDLEDDDTSDDSTLESSFEKDPSGSLVYAEHVMVRMTVFLITIFTR